ncbi:MULTISPECIES: hypothetical protein [unclassified Butyrivibrio]|nr:MULTISPECIES: hypothetical protein [unclassified Butyrivibrio]SDB57422.1 hypothetical protein SAMN02910263_02931 [Butyrivibrio sp. INlla16]
MAEKEHSEIQDLYSWLFSLGRGADVEKATKDEAFYLKMLEEYKNR